MTHANDEPAVAATKVPKPLWRRMLVSLALLAACAAGATAMSRGDNFHVVVPDRVFRSAQPTPQRLRDYAQRYGVRSVVNLRGPWPNSPWYVAEHQAAAALGIDVRDVNLLTHQLAPLREVRKLIAAIDECQKPILLHCRKGADRTSLATALYLVLYEGYSLDEARSAYGWTFGHTGWARGYQLPHLFDCYSNWLAKEGLEHSPDRLRQWVAGDHILGYFGAAITPVDFPRELKAGTSHALRFRVTNTSREPWETAFPTNWGIHFRLEIFRDLTQPVAKWNLELPQSPVAPGATIEIVTTLPPLPPGSFALLADLVDGSGIRFAEMGHSGWNAAIAVHDINLVR